MGARDSRALRAGGPMSGVEARASSSAARVARVRIAQGIFPVCASCTMNTTLLL